MSVECTILSKCVYDRELVRTSIYSPAPFILRRLASILAYRHCCLSQDTGDLRCSPCPVPGCGCSCRNPQPHPPVRPGLGRPKAVLREGGLPFPAPLAEEPHALSSDLFCRDKDGTSLSPSTGRASCSAQCPDVAAPCRQIKSSHCPTVSPAGLGTGFAWG